MSRGVCEGETGDLEEMSLEVFIQGDHADLNREINDSMEVLNEKAGGFHYKALTKIHQTLIGAGFKHIQSSNRVHHYGNDVIRHPVYGMHVVASWAGYKLRLPSGQIVTGRHYKHLQTHLGKYSGSVGAVTRSWVWLPTVDLDSSSG
jgi:hypothetical protein